MSKIIENPKQLILDTASEIMYRDGYGKLNIRNVAKECNISVGTIYNYYPTKNELIIDLMSGYWDEFFHVVDEILHANDHTWANLRKIHAGLEAFIRRFKEVWLMDRIYSTPDIVQDGIKKEHVYMKLLIGKIEEILNGDHAFKNSSIAKKIGLGSVAEFILLNMITIIQTPAMSYETFEKVLKELVI